MPGAVTAFQTGVHGSRPAASAGCIHYSCTTHSLIYQSDGTTWTTWATLTGTGLSDPMTTRGDIIVRNSSNVTARLGIGSSGKVLKSDGTDISWQTPAAGGGTELDYVQITSSVGITNTTEGTAHTCITGTSQAYAAAPTLIQVFCPRIDTTTTSASAVVIVLFDGGTVIGRLGVINTTAGAAHITAFHGIYRLTPTAATHQYIVKAYTTSGAGASFTCGAGGTGVELPAFIRVTLV